MRRQCRTVRIAIGAVSCITLVGLGQDTPAKPSLVVDLNSPDPYTRIAATKRILEDRKATVDALIAMVDQEADGVPFGSDLELKPLAIGLLGEFRDPKAIPALMNNLKYKIKVSAGSTGAALSPGNSHPAVAALILIGHPVLERAWYRVEMSDDPEERELCAYILGRIQGREVVGLLVERKLAKVDRLRRERLEKALTLVENIP